VASDTLVSAERVLIEGLRRMSPRRKLEQVAALNETVRRLCLVGIRARHPGIGEPEARLRLGTLMLGAETMRRAFGWDPEAKGR
jgi:hypothetical protein